MQDDELDGVSASGSLSDADDADVATALNQRIKQIATTTGEWGSSMDEEEMRQPLTGEVRRVFLEGRGRRGSTEAWPADSRVARAECVCRGQSAVVGRGEEAQLYMDTLLRVGAHTGPDTLALPCCVSVCICLCAAPTLLVFAGDSAVAHHQV